jgi:phage tail tape-measure protein
LRRSRIAVRQPRAIDLQHAGDASDAGALGTDRRFATRRIVRTRREPRCSLAAGAKEPDMSKSNPENLDPITKTPGAHPVGTGVGAVGGAAAGAAVGSAGGPIGTIAGGVVGAVAGGLAGKGIAKIVDPEDEDRHWSESYQRTPYYDSALSYADYRPAYELGYRMRAASDGTFEQSERRLSQDWALTRGESRLTWEQAKQAARDAWNRATD